MATENTKHLLEELQTESELLKNELKRYTNTFSKTDFFTFSGSEERKKQYTSAYNRLSLKMPLTVARIEQLCAKLAGLLIVADRAANAELANKLNGIFIAHTAFEERLAEFVETSERELASPAPSPTVLNNAANRLIAAVESLV